MGEFLLILFFVAFIIIIIGGGIIGFAAWMLGKDFWRAAAIGSILIMAVVLLSIVQSVI
jgi:hypothetical protein